MNWTGKASWAKISAGPLLGVVDELWLSILRKQLNLEKQLSGLGAEFSKVDTLPGKHFYVRRIERWFGHQVFVDCRNLLCDQWMLNCLPPDCCHGVAIANCQTAELNFCLMKKNGRQRMAWTIAAVYKMTRQGKKLNANEVIILLTTEPLIMFNFTFAMATERATKLEGYVGI